MSVVRTEEVAVEAWRRCWRDGIAPQLSDKGLEGLRMALECDDERLITGRTIQPPALSSNEQLSVEGCCPLSYGLLDGQRPESWMVGELENKFAAALWAADRLCGFPAAAKTFLNWVDSVPRVQMRTALLLEVVAELAQRRNGKRSRVCPSCGSINVTGETPAVDDENSWRRLALDHSPQCLWIKQRAGQRVENEWHWKPKPTPLAKLLEDSIAAVKSGQTPKPAA